MKIVISEIPKEGFDTEFEETIQSESFTAPVRAQFRIEKVGTEVTVKGNLKAKMALQCSRCLNRFYREVEIPIELVYHPVEELKGEEHHEIAAEELNMDFYTGDELDLLDLLKEQVVLNIPMKPLCSELCKGICPRCGTDLNADTCTCGTENIDPRFEELKKLLDK
jgi:uncharacterized protein